MFSPELACVRHGRPARVISYINMLCKELTYAGAWSAGRPRPVEHTRTSYPDVCAEQARAKRLECRRHGPNTLHTAGGRGAPPLPGAKSLRSSKQNPLFPATDQHAPPFPNADQAQWRMGAGYFCGGGQKEDFVFESAPPVFHQSGSFPIKRGSIYLAGL
jgi:hypothetical protein